MIEQRNIFGGIDVLSEPPRLPSGRLRKATKPQGYTSTPGAGPAGESCGSCKHCLRIKLANTYLKCDLTNWTHGAATGIRSRSAACKYWESL